MKYNIYKLDGRYRYRNWFEYYVGFSQRMSNGEGPLSYNQALKFLTEAYGWSAEVRQYEEIHNWLVKKVPMMAIKGGWVNPSPKDLPVVCNPHWSWTNVYGDLRIYLATDKELAYFQLAHTNEK